MIRPSGGRCQSGRKCDVPLGPECLYRVRYERWYPCSAGYHDGQPGHLRQTTCRWPDTLYLTNLAGCDSLVVRNTFYSGQFIDQAWSPCADRGKATRIRC